MALASITALIVSTQPLLTTASAFFLFGEKPRLVQWIGIFIGFAGVVVVISPSIGINAQFYRSLPVFLVYSHHDRALLQKHVGNSIDFVEKQHHSGQRRLLFYDSDCHR